MNYLAGEFMILENNLENLYEMTKKFKQSKGQNIFDEMNLTLLELINYHKELCRYIKLYEINEFLAIL